jgi:hypothetical protein
MTVHDRYNCTIDPLGPHTSAVAPVRSPYSLSQIMSLCLSRCRSRHGFCYALKSALESFIPPGQPTPRPLISHSALRPTFTPAQAPSPSQDTSETNGGPALAAHSLLIFQTLYSCPGHLMGRICVHAAVVWVRSSQTTSFLSAHAPER